MVRALLGEGPRRGHIGEQDEAARLFLQAGNALGLDANGCLLSL
jgi:hypothetical protein